jgi:ABC-2 type transport system ATP-binding protein
VEGAVIAAEPAVLAHMLTKRYSEQRGVADVSFEVKRGDICALLGPNGAGKTTTMRMLVGLSRPDGGSAALLGRPSKLAADVLSRVGVLIDGPAFVPHLSGERNLRLLWRACGRTWPPPALEDSLTLAGLGPALGRKVKTYSTGMRQRLTLAQAFMGAPDVLVLDEPANGLDPAEVRALREHLTGLAQGGAAILVSSHLLGEVERLASDIVVLDKGIVVSSGPLGQLLRAGAHEFEVDDIARARAALVAVRGVQAIAEQGGRLLVTAPSVQAQELTRRLVAAGVGLLGMRTSRLEDVFLELVEGREDDAAR